MTGLKTFEEYEVEHPLHIDNIIYLGKNEDGNYSFVVPIGNTKLDFYKTDEIKRRDDKLNLLNLNKTFPQPEEIGYVYNKLKEKGLLN